jgi:hypothetical protein
MPTIKFEDLARDSTTSFTPKLYDNRRVSDPWLGFNKNIYTPWQHRKEGLGLYSTINGELDKNNLHDNFLIQKQHIMPEQAVMARMESLRDSCTIYGRSSDSFFLSWNNWMGRFKDAFRSSWGQGVFTEISLRCLVDGKVIEGTNRRLGENFFHPVSPGAPNQQSQQMYGPGLDSFGGDEASYSSDTDYNGAGNPKYCFPEAHSATYFDLHSLLSTEHLKKGYHEISVQCSIRSLKDANGEKPGPVFIQNVGKQVQWSDKDSHAYKLRGHFTLVGKVSFGVRNARVVSFL